MDLSDYRSRPSEKARTGDLMDLLPDATDSALDIGARDGFLSKHLANQFLGVTALDLEQTVIDHERILCVKGTSPCWGLRATPSTWFFLRRSSGAHSTATVGEGLCRAGSGFKGARADWCPLPTGHTIRTNNMRSLRQVQPAVGAHQQL